jgi:CRP-like cAMP-binding protein
VSYSVRDILWLRLFAVAAAITSLPYFVLQSEPLWAPLAWSVLFAALNLYQSYRLLMERRPVKLLPDEELVRRMVLPGLAPRKVLQVLSLGSWIGVEPGERLIERGSIPEAVSLIVRGKVRMAKAGRVVGELGPGQIVGSALILAGVPAEVDAVAAGPVRAMRWNLATLEGYLAANPDTRQAMQKHLARDLAGKVHAAYLNTHS